jgi:hypothetical protein
MKQLATRFIRPTFALVLMMAIIVAMTGCDMAQLYNLNLLVNWGLTQVSSLGL